jgi:hypothetical protein|tara:strand:- start:1998 stop:2171 length:174 start_codon:yes stop_codon:yes gene_type:complete
MAITLKQHPYTGKRSNIPEIILVKGAERATSEIEDILSLEALLQMKMQSILRSRMYR